jgi:hypothetical protein
MAEEFKADTKVDIDYSSESKTENNPVPRLEEIVGDLVRVTTTPTYTPRNFNEAVALDTSDNIIYYYDYTNNAWKSVNSYALTDDLTQDDIDAITGAASPSSSNVFATIDDIPDYSTISLTAGEAISQDDAVVIGEGASSATISVNATGIDENLSTSAIWAQTFTTTTTPSFVHQIDLLLGWGGTGTWEFTAEIWATSGGAPTGSSLGSATWDKTEGSGANTGTGVFTFSTPVELSGSTVYAIVVYVDNTSNDPYWRYSNGFGYSGGAQWNDTGSWVSPNSGNNDFGFYVYESSTSEGKVFRADASDNDSRANNFIGFAESAISDAATGTITVGPIITFLSGLTPGATYFLSDTSGSISTSAGSQSRKIGIALSSTALLIKHDNV